jgi:hypothetical protein
MLRAFFDDAGTHEGGRHGPSGVVVVAGVFGTEAEMVGLEKPWQQHLARPLDGTKPPLSRFHMTDCQNGQGEFIGWSRTETDYFCHQLGTLIIESGVSAYGMACVRDDWENLVIGDVRSVLGDPEGHCVRSCFLKATIWAQTYAFDQHLMFIFDDRPHRQRENKIVFNVFQSQTAPPPELVGVFFNNSRKIPALQAADLIAWEVYQHGLDIVKAAKVTPPKRDQLNRLRREIRIFDLQIARRDAIQKVVQNALSNPHLKDMADWFGTFDPDALVFSRKPTFQNQHSS